MRQAMPRRSERVRTRTELVERLRERSGEIEEALLTRVYAIADPREAADPEYALGLKAAVAAALDFGLKAIEGGEERAPLPPAVALTQARIAARNGVPLDTVLRRYFAGYTLLNDFLMQEAEQMGIAGERALKHLVRSISAPFDRLIAAVTEEYEREGIARLPSTEQRRAERIERLLAGEAIDTTAIAYDFGGWHVGAVACGPGAAEGVRELAQGVDCRLLLLGRDERTAWAWLGSRQALDPDELVRAAASLERPPVAIALGEPGKGLAGWRFTHRQAAAALAVAQRGGERVVRYADVALLATALRDELLSASLWQLYLEPLEGGRDEGVLLRRTLLSYFDCECNAASAAAALGVTRQTVNNRLRAVEERIGCPIGSCTSELEIALRLPAS